jgi:leader peptidase (prepilin peptidase) / N-methyltransferase
MHPVYRAQERQLWPLRLKTVYSTSHMIQVLGTAFAVLLGLAFGSFLNVCLSRWPNDESIVSPRSHCRGCDHMLSWWENVPLLSWLALRGCCRKCRTWIGWRYPLVELAVAALWGVVAWRSFHAFVPLQFTVGIMLLTWVLVGLAVLDAEHLWLPDALTLPGIAIGFVWRFLGTEQVERALKMRTAPWEYVNDAVHQLLGILAAAALILLIRWVYWLIRRREGIGLGDAKLMALLAAWLGLPGALLSFEIGVMLGALTALITLVVPAARTGTDGWALQKLPLGTFLCVGGIISALWGHPIIAAYRQWVGF